MTRIWASLMGRGRVMPVDDLRATNPPTHPELRAWLVDDFRKHGYQLEHLIRRIVLSEAYGRETASATADALASAYYAHRLAKPLDAAVLADAIGDVTGIPFPTNDSAPRAILLVDPWQPSPELDALGRCSVADECAQSMEGPRRGLSEQLGWLTGPVLNGPIASPRGRLHRWLDSGARDAAILDDLYRRCFGYPPAEADRARWLADLGEAARDGDLRDCWEDLMWSWLASPEFGSNH